MALYKCCIIIIIIIMIANLRLHMRRQTVTYDLMETKLQTIIDTRQRLTCPPTVQRRTTGIVSQKQTK